MTTNLEARAVIDDNLKGALARHRDIEGFATYAKELRSKGYGKITRKALSKMLRAGKPNNNYSTVPSGLYREIVGEEPNKKRQRESIYLARRIAYWHCFFFDVKQSELIKQIAEDVQQHGLDCNITGMRAVLFRDKKRISIDHTLTGIVAERFNNAPGKAQFSSLDEIEEFINYLDNIHTGKYKPNRVSWNDAEPVINDLMILTGESFTSIVGRNSLTRKRFESGEKTISMGQYCKLQRRLQEHPQYGQLVQNRLKVTQALRCTVDILGSMELNSNGVDLQLINKGIRNYGEKAFMDYIFPVYIAIKQGHAFPRECFEMVVNFPEKMNGNCKVPELPLDVIAANVGNRLLEYKTILDINKSRGFDIGVTRDGIEARLGEAIIIRPYNGGAKPYSSIAR